LSAEHQFERPAVFEVYLKFQKNTTGMGLLLIKKSSSCLFELDMKAYNEDEVAEKIVSQIIETIIKRVT
jgi:hypothetical protein